jgi:hypothetical protein
MIKKELIIAILATFCLTATLFLIIPISGQAVYDPQLDVNHDGKIDIKDIAAVAKAFGTTGDPTVPVNVTWVSSNLAQLTIYIPSSGGAGSSGGSTTVGLSVSGYSRAWIWLSAPWGSSAASGTYSMSLTLTSIEWTGGPSQPPYVQVWQTITSSQISSILVQVVSGVIASSSSPATISEDSYISVKAPYIASASFSCTFSSGASSGSVPVTLCIYLQNQ